MAGAYYYVLSPRSDQARAISRFLQQYRPDMQVVGAHIEAGSLKCDGAAACGPVALADPHQDAAHSIIPTGAESTRSVLQHRSVTLGEITLSRAALRVFDKPWMIDFAAQAGLLVPRTWRSLSEIERYPVFYKSDYECGSGPRGIARGASDIQDLQPASLIYQEIIEGPGTYGVAFLASEGELLTSFTHLEKESLPREGGSAVVIERYESRALIDYTCRLLAALRYSGWGLVEFKYCPRRHDFVFMEVNAKFWASCEFAFVNQPEFLRLLFGIESRERPVKRMIFLERAFLRGASFMLLTLPRYLLNSRVHRERGWWKVATKAMLPRTAVLARRLMHTS